VENSRLEFKSEVPDKDETLKKLSSFGNTFGGFMIVGAKANSADGRIEGLPGVDEQSGYKQKIVDWCFNGVSPPLIVEVSDPISAPGNSKKVCYVVHTAESDVAPHFLNGRKGIWVRTDEFSARFEARLANENEIRHLLDRRKVIRERRQNVMDRSIKRFGTHLASKHTNRDGAATPVGPRLELSIIPRFPARPLCEQEALRSLINQGRFNWRGTIFPLEGSTTISQHESAIVLTAAGDDSIFEVNLWGLLFYGMTIADNFNPQQLYGIHTYAFVGHTLLFIRLAAKMLRLLGYSGPIQIQVGLHDMRGVPWLYGVRGLPGVLTETKRSVLDNEIEFGLSGSSDALNQGPDGVLMDILKIVFFSINWSGAVDTPEKLADLVYWGYQYNQWPKPDKLLI